MDVLFNGYVWVFYLSGHKQLRAIWEIIQRRKMTIKVGV